MGATPVHCDCGRVRDFEVIDSYPFGVEFTWEKDGAPHTETLFKRAGPIPSTKMLTFFRCAAWQSHFWCWCWLQACNNFTPSHVAASSIKMPSSSHSSINTIATQLQVACQMQHT